MIMEIRKRYFEKMVTILFTNFGEKAEMDEQMK
jgi:hypothetical protein